jgi:indolepyruvate ferredoxin oxidoreductase beta subunit
MSVFNPSFRTCNIAISALGGQGGGVLMDWIVNLAEHAGWTAQATSVAGVAQRTGATIYYIELVEPTPGRIPVLALMPIPGQVDVLIAAEIMEAGRAVERGFITPDRTTVIASNHRIYAVTEKIAPGDGTADTPKVLEIVRQQAKRAVIDDMQQLAASHGSLISASLFGALAGSGVLPFELADFEAVIERSGVSVKTSLMALRAAAASTRSNASAEAEAKKAAQDAKVTHATQYPTAPNPMVTPARALPERAASPALQPLVDRIRKDFPQIAWHWLAEGLAQVTQWQDVAYGTEYLNRVEKLLKFEQAMPFDESHEPTFETSRAVFAIEAARWIAVAMSYDDAIWVSDLKSRSQRHARVRGEIGAAANANNAVVTIEEYFHPRIEEVLDVMPAGLAGWIESHPSIKGWISRRLAGSRRIQSHTVIGHLQLTMVASLRKWRRGNRRHGQEMARLDAWLARAQSTVGKDRAIAIELLRCQRLIKGYSDTQSRGSERFNLVMRVCDKLLENKELDDYSIAPVIASVREAALSDAEGKALSKRLNELGFADLNAKT